MIIQEDKSVVHPVMPCGENYNLQKDYYFTCQDCVRCINNSCPFLKNLSNENKIKLEKQIGTL